MRIVSKRLLAALLAAIMVLCLSAATPLFAQATPTFVPIYEVILPIPHFSPEEITQQPQNDSVRGSGTRSFHVGVQFTHTVSYQWQYMYNKTWVSLSEGSSNEGTEFSYSGTTKSTLNVTGYNPGMVQLRCIVKFACGSKITIISDQVLFTVLRPLVF
jgi:hypothetical protein